jgi:lysophospholipase L1-like esterase
MRSLLLLSLLLFSRPSLADPIAAAPVDTPEWRARHESFLATAQAGNIDLLFLGDSITDFWRTTGAPVWEREYAPKNAANFGLAGDRAENVLWRIENGEIDGLSPKVVVLLIGTNNLPWYSAEQTAETHQALVTELQLRLPASRLLVLAVFPRVDDWSKDFRDKVAPLNALIVKESGITYLDIGAAFGDVSKDVMPDGLHPSLLGYQLWADAMRATLDGLLAGSR